MERQERMKKQRIISLLLLVALAMPVIIPVVSAHELDPGDGVSETHMRACYSSITWSFEKETKFLWWTKTIYEEIRLDVNDLSVIYERIPENNNFVNIPKSVNMELDLVKVQTDFWSIHNWDIVLKVSNVKVYEAYQRTWYASYSHDDVVFSENLNINKDYTSLALDVTVHCYSHYYDEHFDLVYELRLNNPNDDWRSCHREEALDPYNPDWIEDLLVIFETIDKAWPNPPQ